MSNTSTTIEVIKILLDKHKNKLLPIVDNLISKNYKEASKQLNDLGPIIYNICEEQNLSYEEFCEDYCNPTINKEIMEMIVKEIYSDFKKE